MATMIRREPAVERGELAATLSWCVAGALAGALMDPVSPSAWWRG